MDSSIDHNTVVSDDKEDTDVENVLPHGQVTSSHDQIEPSEDKEAENITKQPVNPVPSSGPELRPQDLDLARARALGYPTEETLTRGSATSSLSYVDLEKGVGSVVIQHQLGADNIEESDNPSKRLSWARQDSSRPASWKISRPPEHVPALPSKRERRIWRRMRYTLFAVYQRLFSIVFLSNMIALVIALVRTKDRHPSGPSIGNLSTATAANITVTVLIRQEFIINALYATSCSVPHSFPLRIRRLVAKVYEFGGVHSGSAISGTIWFIIFTAFLTRDYLKGYANEPVALAIAYVLLALLLSICALATPHFRVVSHNTFEAVHRFAGWLAVALFWVLAMLVLKAQSKVPGSESLGMLVVQAPTFWFLLFITFCIILPWLRLRKVDVVTEKLSNHAIRMHFKYTDVGPVMGIRITHSPLKEWHSFASIPGSGKAFSIIVSDAGDWTKQQINSPSTNYWVRGIPVAGVLRMALVFKKVVIVTTGSGIGPTLSMLHAHPLPARILWSTPNPEQTYGQNILDAVGQADPEALIINSRSTGRPDMVALAYHLFLESKAEAVFVLSNPTLTRKVVYGMESRGIPAFGPVFDS